MSDQPIGQRSHISFRKVNLERPRYKPAGRRRPPERDNIEHGQEIGEAAVILNREFEESVQDTPPEFDPAFIFRLTLDEYVDHEEWRRSGLTLLSEESSKVVVLFSDDQIEEFQSRIGQYGQEVPENQRSPRYSWIASLTNDMSLWGREDRIGKKLSEIEIVPENEYRVDVELWHYRTVEECRERLNELRDFTENNNGVFLDHFVGIYLTIARISITGDVLDELLKVGIVQRVDLPPEPVFGIGQLINTPIDDFPTPIEHPPDDAPGICIIDSGINHGHPMLGLAIGDSRSIPPTIGDALDENGHGTMVAGIALFGNVKECIDKLDFSPELRLYNARVTNKDNRFDDDRLIVNQMNDAIRYFHSEYGCRVFNISLGDPKLIYDGGKPSAWTYILDHLARELDAVIITTSGNIPILGVHGQLADYYNSTYPIYLLEEDSRLLEPGTAVNAITVGSLAHTEQSYLMARYRNDPAIRCIAHVNQPSPFTRRGPGINNSIKPDVCEYGGNATWTGRPSRILDIDAEASIVSMNHRHLERLFRVDVGTSFAGPKVAHLAGMILAHYPGISANLVRALIANSSAVPDETIELFEDNDDILKICGYGLPDPNRALYSTGNSVTLIADDRIQLDKLHLYKIPILDEFKNTRGKRQISVSLAFTPPVRHTRKDYLGVKMDYYLFRGLSTEQIINWYAERPQDADPESIHTRHRCNMVPSLRRRENNTLQKAVFTASRNPTFTNYEGEELHLLVRCKAGWASPDEYEHLRYGLAVSIEHLEEPIELYDTIQQRIVQEQRVRVRA